MEDASFEIKTCLSWFWKLALNPLWSLIILQAGLQLIMVINWIEGEFSWNAKEEVIALHQGCLSLWYKNTFARLCFVLLFTSKSPAVPVQCRIITSDILTSRLAPICQTVLRCPGHLKSPRGGRVGGLFSVFSISQFPDLSHSVIWSLSLHLSLSHTHTHNVGHFWRME